MKRAMTKAIEGGFERPRLMDGRWEDIHQTLLRPAFWKALGKAEGWGEIDQYNPDSYNQWRTNWHRFIDHLALGKDVDSFFTELLTNTK